MMYWSKTGLIIILGLVAVAIVWMVFTMRRSRPGSAWPSRQGLHGRRYGMVLTLLCLVFLGAYLLNEHYDRQQLIKSFQAMELYDAQKAADRLQREISILQSQLRVLARDPNIVNLNDTGKKLLQEYNDLDLKPKPWVCVISRVTDTGKIIYTAPDESFIGRDLSAQPHHQRMLKEHRSLVSFPFNSIQGFRAVTVMEPIFDGNRFMGSIGIVLDFNVLIKEYIQTITTGGLALAGVIDQDLQILISTDANYDGRTLGELGKRSSSLLECVARNIYRESGIDTFLFDRKDHHRPGPARELVGYAVARLTPHETWTIFVTARERDVLARTRGLGWPHVLGATLFVLLVITASRKHLSDERRHTSTLESEIECRLADLRQSEERFQQLFKQSTVGLMILDCQGNLLDVNRAVSTILGVPLEQFANYNLLDDAAWAATRQREAVRQVLEGRATSFEASYTVGCEGPFADLPLHTVQLDLKLFPMLNEQGQPVKIMMACLDITERKRHEASLRKINRALKTLSSGNQALVRASDERELLAENCRILTDVGGYRMAWVALVDPEQPDRLIPMAQSSLPWDVSEDDERCNGAARDAADHPARQAVREGKACVIQDLEALSTASVWRSEALRRGFASMVALPLMAHGRAIGVLCVYAGEAHAFDQEELPLLEELCDDLSYGLLTLRQRDERNRIAASRKLLTKAIEQVGDAIYITDVQRIIIYVNPAFTQMTGYSAEEALGQTPFFLKRDKLNDEQVNLLRRTIRGGQSWSGHVVFERKDGDLADVEIMVSPVRDEAGTITHFVAACRDVTTERNLEEQLRQSQKMDAIGKLAGGVAHDFNNLLTGIMGNVEMAQMSGADKARHYLGAALEASGRASELVRQLLTFSRKSAGTRTAVRLDQIMYEVARLVEKTIDRRINIELRSVERTPSVMADPNQLHQVLMNLCVNARDALVTRLEDERKTNPGENNQGPLEARLTLAVDEETVGEDYCQLYTCARPGRFAVLAVSDNGTGMDAKTQVRIFEPFYTTKGEGKGTGLGLSTVYGIVKGHNGWVHVESHLGQGTTFKVYLPLLKQEAAEPLMAGRWD